MEKKKNYNLDRLINLFYFQMHIYSFINHLEIGLILRTCSALYSMKKENIFNHTAQYSIYNYKTKLFIN